MGNDLFIHENTQPVFKCPYCNEIKSHKWKYLMGPFYRKIASKPSKEGGDFDPFKDDFQGVISCYCNSCKSNTFWLRSVGGKELQIYPNMHDDYPEPNKDMPEHIKGIYNEAGSVIHLSLGSAAALARLTLEKLLEHLGYSTGTLYDRINKLEKNQDISSTLKQKLHIVRKIGNTGAHTGSISFEEKPDTPEHLMKIINDIVDELITKPKTLKELESLIDN